MRIEIKPSAQTHHITDNEIRALIGYPALRISLTPRLPSAVPVLFIGPPVIDEPWIEVIADLRDPTVAEVFHAMMLRPTLVASLRLDDLIEPEYAQQRA